MVEVGFQIPRVGFRIPGTGFRIPKPWIPNSKGKKMLDSGFRIPDSLTWGDDMLQMLEILRVHRLTESSPSPSQIRVRVKLTESSVSGL